MRLSEFLMIVSDRELLLNFLFEQKLIRQHAICQKCGTHISVNRETLILRCSATTYKVIAKKKRQRVRCSYSLSALTDTWFSKIHHLEKLCKYVGFFLWFPPPHVEVMVAELMISNTTSIDYSFFCRDICLHWIKNRKQRIGGIKCIVEIDIVKLGPKNHNKSRVSTDQWVCGGIDRKSKKVFIEPVESRDATSLLSIIRGHIADGTTIQSVFLSGCDCLNKKEFKNLTRNHSIKFVDLESDVHTQNITRVWRDLWDAVPKYGRKKANWPYYIAEYLFKREHEYCNRIEAFFTTIREVFPIVEP